MSALSLRQSRMRSPQKNNRPRGKGHRKSSGAAINRVYESSGPEGKVRGTPQQIIDKYQAQARDKATAGDRVLAENLLQHAEHYVRILTAAQQRREEEEAEAAQREAQRAEQQADAMSGAEDDEGGEGSANPENLSQGRRRDEGDGEQDEGRRRPRRSRGRSRNRDDAPETAEAGDQAAEAPEGLAVIDTGAGDDSASDEWTPERSAAL